MKILAVSDVIEPALYQPLIRERFGSVEMVLACGDLPNAYLEYIVTMLNKPLYYVFGNHDANPIYTSTGPRPVEPEGCINLDGRIVNHKGLLLAGLQGSMRYKLDGGPQYTDGEMWRHALKLIPGLLWNRLQHGRYLDVLITHAPPYGVHDASDLCHTGFKAFLWLMKRFRPGYLIHGHIHLYGNHSIRRTVYGSTLVVNACGHQVIEWRRS
ncbi:MAG: metallophosphoesterase family protein [Chloroflexota bacterium]